MKEDKEEKKNKKRGFLAKRIIIKDLLKKEKQATVVTEVPEYDLTEKMDRDRSRFFKKTWEEEKKRLFFK